MNKDQNNDNEKKSIETKDLQVFEHPEFGSIRSFEENGEIMFVGKDVAVALGYAKPVGALKRHCKYLNPFKVSETATLGLHPDTHIIPESDVYRLIFRSQLPRAEEFQDWVMDEVLPSVHEHGLYATKETVEDLLSNPARLVEIFTNYQVEQEKRKLAAKQRDDAVQTKARINAKCGE